MMHGIRPNMIRFGNNQPAPKAAEGPVVETPVAAEPVVAADVKPAQPVEVKPETPKVAEPAETTPKVFQKWNAMLDRSENRIREWGEKAERGEVGPAAWGKKLEKKYDSLKPRTKTNIAMVVLLGGMAGLMAILSAGAPKAPVAKDAQTLGGPAIVKPAK